MMNNGRALGIIIEYLSEKLEQYVFPDKSRKEISETNLNMILKKKANLSLDKIINLPFSEIEKKLLKVDSITLDQTIEFLYREYKTEGQDSKLRKKINLRLTNIIDYLNKNNNEISITRNNILNSIHHH